PYQDRRLIARGRCVPRRALNPFETAVPLGMEESERPALPAADDEIVTAISVHVAPSHARSELAQLFRQKRLALKIVKILFMMVVIDSIAYIFEQCGTFLRKTFCVASSLCAAAFIDLIKAIRFHAE